MLSPPVRTAQLTRPFPRRGLAPRPATGDAWRVQTYSHFLVTALAGHRVRRRTQVRLTPLLAGSVLPDVPLILLTAWYFQARERLGLGDEFLFGPTYDRLYFENPVWIVATGVFHAPLLIGAMVAVGTWLRQRDRPWGGSLLWFGLGCGLHALLDIPTHRGDGPLLLFPLDWRFRFESPISYWDPNYHAGIVATVEHGLDLAILVYFAVLGVRRWRRSRSSSSGAAAGRERKA